MQGYLWKERDQMETITTEEVVKTMTAHQASEELVPEFTKIARALWPSGDRDLRSDLVQEMTLSCLTFDGPAPVAHFLVGAYDAAVKFLRMDKRQQQAEPMEDHLLIQASDRQ